MRRLVAVALAGVALVVALAGCGNSNPIEQYKNSRGKGDAGVESTDDTPKQVINFPNGFSNVATACDGHGHRIFVTTQNTNGKFLAVIADDKC